MIYLNKDDGLHLNIKQNKFEFFRLTVGELQHLVDDPRLVLRDPHVLQDLDHHLQKPTRTTRFTAASKTRNKTSKNNKIKRKLLFYLGFLVLSLYLSFISADPH